MSLGRTSSEVRLKIRDFWGKFKVGPHKPDWKIGWSRHWRF